MPYNIIAASTSTLYKQEYLEYLLPTLEHHFKYTSTILFIPYARPSGISHDAYTEIAQIAFKKINKKVIGIHQFQNAKNAVFESEGIFTGGGNSFKLVNELYVNQLITPLKEHLSNEVPYLGTSAGANICGQSIKTSNDMPIVYPPSFDTLGILPFNINPHYIDSQEKNTHMGETRIQRIKEYHTYNKLPVIGLREGSWITYKKNEIILNGTKDAVMFCQGNEAIVIKKGSKHPF